MEREKGFESGTFPVVTRPDAVAHAASPSATERADASDRSYLNALPSPVPSFLEAYAKLVSEAVMRGDLAQARELIEHADRLVGTPKGGTGPRD